jgi:hypothetical protein
MAKIEFLTNLSEKLLAMTENNRYYAGTLIRDTTDENEKAARVRIDMLVEKIKAHKTPIKTDELFEMTNLDHPNQVSALCSMSKNLSTLNDFWGLRQWGAVNQKKIRERAYEIFKAEQHPIHYKDLTAMLSKNNGKKVTVEAVHNEILKDKSFVLIGRGIYALAEWGYKRGTIADIITDILKSSNAPMKRPKIVEAVLKQRQVRESTILLNLQNKPEFKRVGVGMYTYDEAGVDKT